MDVLLSTNTANDLVLTLQSKQDEWSYVMKAEGPELMAGEPCIAPQKTAEMIWQWGYKAQQITGQRHINKILAHFLTLDLKEKDSALFYDTPGSRKKILHIHHYVSRMATDPMVDPEVAAALLTYSTKLAEYLRKYEPAKSVSDEGPTRQTAERLTSEPLEQLAEKGVLSLDQQEAGREVRTILRAIIRKLDARAGNYELGAMGSPSRYLHPIETMPDALLEIYEERYRPWSQRIAQVPWHDVNGRPLPNLERCRAQADVTLWHAVFSVLGLAMPVVEVEAKYKLPQNHAILMLRRGLSEYGR